MKIRIYYCGQRIKPTIGDIRTTKKHGLQIRVVATSDGTWMRNSHGYCYEWRKPNELIGTRWDYLIKKMKVAI